MTLIVEDGSVVVGAESYASVAQANEHFLLRGITIWAPLLEAEKEQALRRATDYMVQTYRQRWQGTRKSQTQALDWPRYSVPAPEQPWSDIEFGVPGYQVTVADNIVPDEVVKSCIELALRAASGYLLEDVGREVLRESVGGAVSVAYRPGTSRHTTYAAVDRWVAPYLKNSGGMIVSRG